MTIRTRLALGLAALAVAVALLAAASLHHLSALHREFVDLTHHLAKHPPAARLVGAELAAGLRRADRTLAEGRVTVAVVLAVAFGLAGALAVGVIRATRPTDDGVGSQEPTPEVATIETVRNPFVDRRGPDRAVNVVRPPFGRRSATGQATEADDWEAF